MSTYSGPNIVKSGLILNLDAANPKSYPGSGTTWTDLSGFGNNGTLINGPTFNSANNGSLVFDGINDYSSIQNSTSLQFGETFSVNCWIYASTVSTRQGIFSTRQSNDTGCWQLEIGTADIGVGRIAVSGINTWIWRSEDNIISNNTWYNICYVKQNNATVGGTIYLNSSTISPQGTSSYTILNNSSIKVLGVGTTSTQFFNGRISHTTLYNKALTQAEVLQNFNALRGRYGI